MQCKSVLNKNQQLGFYIYFQEFKKIMLSKNENVELPECLTETVWTVL